jgi:cytochrome c oxidase cbb3-type subunit III
VEKTTGPILLQAPSIKNIHKRAWLVLLLAVSIGSPAAPQTKTSARQNSNQQAALEGKQAFAANCAGCHGLDGKGSERAPDIATRQQVRELSDPAILSILAKGVPNSSMPAFAFLNLSLRRSILAHLRSLQGVVSRAELPGDAKRGKALFSGKGGCANCHMVQGRGGFFGSDLTNFARSRSPESVRSAIVSPNSDLEPRHRTVVVSLPNGEQLEGIARNEDNFSLQLITQDGGIHLLEKASLAALSYRDKSPMPEEYGKILSPAELDDLIKFLYSTSGAVLNPKSNEEFQED